MYDITDRLETAGNPQLSSLFEQTNYHYVMVDLEKYK